MGVRTDDAALDGAIRAALAGQLVDGSHAANLSVALADHPHSFHRLLWGACTAARSLDVHRVLRALDRHLGGHGPVPEGRIRIDGVAAAGPRGALILPAAARQQIPRLQRHLAGHGLELADAPFAEVDVASGELVVDDPGVLEVASLSAAAGLDEVVRPDDGLPAGRYPIRWWFLASWVAEGPQAPPAALVQAAAHIRPRPLDSATVALLRQLVERVPVRAIPIGDVRLALGPVEPLFER